jgi:hypothetical protein
VTDCNAVVAELRPARRQRDAADDLEGSLQVLAETGEITRASSPKLDWTWTVKELGMPPGTAVRLIDEVRGERG